MQKEYILKIYKENRIPLTFPRLVAKAIYSLLRSLGEQRKRGGRYGP
jgi:hypothetical protein